MTSDDPAAGRPPSPPSAPPGPGSPAWPTGPAVPLAPPTAQARTNGFAVAAMVLGIVWLCGFGSLLAVIFGHVALAQIARSEGWEKGRGMALAGLILGYCGLALLVFGIIVSATTSPSTS
jgi:Domain of unknown function (DUF4190)